jgi:hypothetical protein
VSLRRLVDGIEQAGVEWQIVPDRSAGIQNQWHHAEDGARGQCGGNLRIDPKRLNRAWRWQRLAVVDRIFDPQSHRFDRVAQLFIRRGAGRGATGQIGHHHTIGPSVAIHERNVTHE